MDTQTREELDERFERELQDKYPKLAATADFYRRCKGVDIRLIVLGENTCRVSKLPKSSLSISLNGTAVATVHGPSEAGRTMRAIVRTVQMTCGDA